MKELSFVILALLLIQIPQLNATAANAQSICINKNTGVIRVSEICEQSESKGTRKITAPKLTKVEQLQKKVNDLEAGKKYLDNLRNEAIEKVSKIDSALDSVDAIERAVRDCQKLVQTEDNFQMKQDKCKFISDNLGLLNRKGARDSDKNYITISRLLNEAKFSLEKELKGYKTISCRKGSEVLSITDAKPKCPKGYK